MDHQHLNDLPFFAGINPSSENIARHVYREMQKQAKDSDVKVLRVKVWESESAAVTYIGD
jgi:6-pyruvoyltetrahydropterin/6-carboxytetrahydropterin synthase